MMPLSNCLRGALLAAATLVLAACATVPETGRSQLLLLNPGDEAERALSAFEDKKRHTPISGDRQAQQQLRNVGGRIARVVAVPDARWEFVLFEDEEPNAFALPGGKVGVNTGILPITRDETGLATVVAHEIAHVSARHGAERRSQDMAVQVGGALLSAALGVGSLGTQAIGLGAQYGLLMPYSRLQESEADRIGLMYMARAGYDPREAVAFWQRFQVYNARRGGKGPEFLSTHPLDETRITDLQRFVPQALVEYQRAGGRG